MNELKENAGMTCADLMQLPHFREAKLLAGMDGLTREVRHVNVMEVPDVAEWVRPGELLLTTGYPFKEQPMALMHLIPALHASGVAALGIKTKRFIDAIPPAALALADRIGFPLLELPAGTVFSEVMREVMEHVLHSELEQLAELQERVQLLTNGLLEGGGLEKLLLKLEKQLANPLIWIEDIDRMRWKSVAKENEPFVDALALNSEWLSSVRPNVRRGEVEWEHGIPLQRIWFGERQVRVHQVVISLANRRQAVLLAVEWNQPFRTVDLLTLDRIKSVIALELMNADALLAIETKYRDPFVQDWLWGRVPGLNDLRFRAEACGCPLPDKAKYVVTIAYAEESLNRMSTFWTVDPRYAKQGEPLAGWIVQMDADPVIVLAYHPEEVPHREKWGKKLISWLREGTLPGVKALCFGSIVQSPVELPSSYQEALRVARLHPVSRTQGEIVTYERLGIFPLLMQLADTQERRRMLKSYVFPILEADRGSSGQLMQTLHVYFLNNRNVRKTAEQLFTHYNTILYRLERVQKVLGVDLDQGEHMLMLEVALKLYDLDRVHSGNH